MRVKDISGMTWEELGEHLKIERALEAEKNDPYTINRYSNDDGASSMHMNPDGEFVYYCDYIDKIERLKKIHEEELKRVYSRGHDDGRNSNYSWRV